MQKDKRSQASRDYRESLYLDKCLAINEIIKRELTEPLPPVRLGDIKFTGIRAVIKGLKIADSNEFASVRNALLENIDAVKIWLVDHGNYLLSGTNTYEQATADDTLAWDKEGKFAHLAEFFEPSEMQQTFTDADVERSAEFYERHKKELGDKIAPPPAKGETITIKGVRIKDFEGLKEAIRQTVRSYQVFAIKEPDYNGDLKRDGLDPVYLEVKRLNQDIGVKPSGGLWARLETNTDSKAKRISFTYGAEYTEPSDDPKIETTDLRMSDRYTYTVLLWTLVRLKRRNDERLANARKINTPVNIQKTYKGDYIPKPPIDMTEADIAQVAKNPESVNTLNKVYRNSQALDAEDGLLATSDPTLFDVLPLEYQSPLKVVSLMNRSYRRGFIALSRYMLQNNEKVPAELDTLDIAKFYGAYAEQIAKHGYLPTAYLNELVTELTLIKGQEVYYTYFDAEIKKEMIGSIKIFNFDISTDGKTIKNLKYSPAYIDAFNDTKRPMLHLAIPKSLDYLKPFEQDIAYRIIQRFVGKRGEREQKQRISKTVNGEALKMSIPELYEGYIPAYDKRSRSRAKARTIKALETIAKTDTNNEIFAKFEIVNEGRKTFVLLYPSDFARNAYKDKTTNASLESLHKNEQKQRRDDLEKLIKLYRKDLRASKDSTEYLDAVAEDLGLKSRAELGKYLLKPDKKKKVYPEEIDDELYDEIKDQIDYYEN